MDLLAPFSRHIIAPLWAAWERSPYLRHYRRMLRTQFDPPEQIRARQKQSLGAIIAHAYRTAPFWKEKLGIAALLPDKARKGIFQKRYGFQKVQ